MSDKTICATCGMQIFESGHRFKTQIYAGSFYHAECVPKEVANISEAERERRIERLWEGEQR